jgi:hypothetical protein
MRVEKVVGTFHGAIGTGRRVSTLVEGGRMDGKEWRALWKGEV